MTVGDLLKLGLPFHFAALLPQITLRPKLKPRESKAIVRDSPILLNQSKLQRGTENNLASNKTKGT